MVDRRLSGGRALLLATLALVASCSSPGSGRVMILGLDGMDPVTVDLLMSEGKLPNLAKLRQEGAYGRLQSQRPLLSPIIWTTIATGKPPTEHGIGHFVTVNEKTGEQMPVTSQMRKVRALWNIFSEQQRKVSIVGYWATWPAEKVHGEMVSDHTCYHFLLEKPGAEAKDLGGETYPPDLLRVLAPLLRTPESTTAAELSPFVDVPAKDLQRPFSFDDDLSHFRWALSAAESYAAIGLELWRKSRPALLMVYIEGTDSTAHLFGHLFRAEGLSGELAEQQKHYGGTVEAMYRYADRVLGDYIAAMDDETTLVVLSDHGFQLGQLQDDPSKTRDMRRVSEQFHREEGILYLYGRHVRRHGALDRASIIDVAPTVLALAGLPPARDMPGRVLTEGLDLGDPARIASYETGTQTADAGTTGSAADPAILERLKSLGYVDGNSPQGDRNLAALHFQAGRFAEAEQSYRALLATSPSDGGLYASLAGALGAQGKLDEALAALDKAITLEPLNPEAYHNRAVIHERKGEREAALRDYRTAIRYNPRYEPSRQALVRLAGAQAVVEPRSATEKLAIQLAERAAEEARRGNYPGAMKTLDEAERAAPGLALVQQYRSNVAYLQGDRAGAIAALQKALAIEPDNELFRANLERLEKPPATKTDAKNAPSGARPRRTEPARAPSKSR